MTALCFAVGWVLCLWAATIYAFVAINTFVVLSTETAFLIGFLATLGVVAMALSEMWNRY